MTAKPWIACALVAAAVVAAHGGIREAQFVAFDDPGYVTDNPRVQGGLTAASARWAFEIDHPNTYFQPLTWLSLMLDRDLFGPGPLGFHAVNVALHALAAVLLLLALSRATGRLGPSTAAVLLFAVHPLTVEGVMWVSERKTVLSAAFGYGAILAYVSYARGPSARRLALVAALMAASLLAKPGFVLLPVLLLVLDFWPLGRLRLGGAADAAAPPPGRLLLEKVPLAVLSAASLAISVVSVRGVIQAHASPAPPGLKVANALASLPTYLGAALWPRDLSVFHPYPTSVPAPQVVAGVAVLVGVTAFAVATAARRPWILAGWAWFLVGLAPYLGLKQAGLWPGWADRFMYVPLVGLGMALSFEAAHWAERVRVPRAATMAAAAAAVVALGLATRAQGLHWQSSEALFRRGVAVEPGNPVMQYNLGTVLFGAGRLAEARPLLEEAVRLRPRFRDARTQLGLLARRQGRLEEAEAQFRATLLLDPNHAEALFQLGSLLRDTGRRGEARPYLVRFVEVAEGKYAVQRAAVQRILARE